jgi:hypothetical protein
MIFEARFDSVFSEKQNTIFICSLHCNGGCSWHSSNSIKWYAYICTVHVDVGDCLKWFFWPDLSYVWLKLKSYPHLTTLMKHPNNTCSSMWHVLHIPKCSIFLGGGWGSATPYICLPHPWTSIFFNYFLCPPWLTRKTGILLHMQWPLTSQSHDSFLKENNWFFVTDQTPRLEM